MPAGQSTSGLFDDQEPAASAVHSPVRASKSSRSRYCARRGMAARTGRRSPDASQASRTPQTSSACHSAQPAPDGGGDMFIMYAFRYSCEAASKAAAATPALVASAASAHTGERCRVLLSVTTSKLVARTVYSQKAKISSSSGDDEAKADGAALPPAAPVPAAPPGQCAAASPTNAAG